MDIKVFKSVTEIDEDEWNAIVGEDSIICTHQYLKAIEQSNINDCDYFYLVVYDDDKLVAHTCTYSMSTDLAIFAQGLWKRLIDLIRKIFPNFLVIKFFECGTPVALGNTISFKEGVDREEVIRLFALKMEKIARKKGIGILLLRDFYKEEIGRYDCLKKSGFSQVPNLPDTFLEIHWDSFEDYLSSFKSWFRKEIKRRLEKLSSDEITVEFTDNFSEYAHDLCKLWKSVYDHASEYKREILTPEYFQYLDIYMKNRSRVVLIKKDGSIIGFAISLIDDRTLRPLYCGLDYGLNLEYDIYFNIYYNLIKLGIEEKKERVEFGITTYQSKLDLGVHLEPLYMYMKHRNRILNPIITRAFRWMTPEINIPEKTHHFKKE